MPRLSLRLVAALYSRTALATRSGETLSSRGNARSPSESGPQCGHRFVPRLVLAFQRAHGGLRDRHAELAVGLELFLVEELVCGSLIGKVDVAPPVGNGIGVHSGDR